MKTRLNYQPRMVTDQVEAAFLRGGKMGAWMATLQDWGIPLAKLECYIVPQSLQSRVPEGLLVVFAGKEPAPANLQCPCYLLGKKLVLPLDATLFPAITAEELDLRLQYARMFYHPTLGLIGFEAADRLNWGDHLLLPAAPQREWNHAHPGFAATPPLQSAKVPPSSLEETLKGMGGDIGSKQLEDSPGGKDGEDDSIFARFKWGLFKGAQQMTKGIMDQFPEGSGEAGAGYNAFAKFANWLGERTQGVQEKRQDAIDKLLDMLNRDLEEALKYAIPLDNPFAGRGMGEMGSDLHARDTRFDPSKFGGTSSGGRWEVDTQRYQSLREKYRQAANDAVAAGDYGKAAYIFAHLLHDFQAAANVLQQGRMYREAAMIYKEHLKNPAGAAECLEKGGLYLEAIELYLELNKWEKAGDLYRALGKEAKALEQYERCVDACLEAADYLGAAKFFFNKMDRLDRALVTYLLGWHDPKQREACLRQYWALVNVPGMNMVHQILQLYQRHTAYEQRNLFLGIVADLLPTVQDVAARKVAKELAFAHFSELAVGGQASQLHLLKPYAQDDRLFVTDILRYVNGSGLQGKVNRAGLRLNAHIRWEASLSIGSTYLSLGRDGRNVWIARWNGAGNVEYVHWLEGSAADEGLLLLCNGRVEDEVFLLSEHGSAFASKVLPKSLQFNRTVTVKTSANLPTGPALMRGCMHADGHLVLLCGDHQGCMILTGYGIEGELLFRKDCRLNDGSPALIHSEAFTDQFFAVPGGYVAYLNEHLIFIFANGEITGMHLESESRAMAVSVAHEPPLLAFETENGCYVIPVTQEAFREQESMLLSTNPGAYRFAFLGHDFLVAVWEDHLRVYGREFDSPVEKGKAAVDGVVTGIVEGAERGSFLLVFQDGNVRHYLIEDGGNISGVVGVFLDEG